MVCPITLEAEYQPINPRNRLTTERNLERHCNTVKKKQAKQIIYFENRRKNVASVLL